MKAALLGLLVVAAALFARPGPDASAHAALARSVPASNDFLRRSPPQIQLDFTEPMQLSATTVTLRTPPKTAGEKWTMVEHVIVEVRRDDDPSINARRNARFLTGNH